MSAGRLRDRARLGDVDVVPVGRHREVVQHREEPGDVGREVVLVDELRGSSRSKARMRGCPRPKSAKSSTQRRFWRSMRIESGVWKCGRPVGRPLERVVRERHRLPVDQLHHLDRRLAVGMQGEEDAARSAPPRCCPADSRAPPTCSIADAGIAGAVVRSSSRAPPPKNSRTTASSTRRDAEPDQHPREPLACGRACSRRPPETQRVGDYRGSMRYTLPPRSQT